MIDPQSLAYIIPDGSHYNDVTYSSKHVDKKMFTLETTRRVSDIETTRYNDAEFKEYIKKDLALNLATRIQDKVTYTKVQHLHDMSTTIIGRVVVMSEQEFKNLIESLGGSV